VKLLARLQGASHATLSRALRRLADQGIVDKTGTTRNAVFKLVAETEHFVRPPHQRPVAAYDAARLDGYEPNKTRWLTVDAEARMRAAAGRLSHHLDAATYSRRISERFRIGLAWASSHLEGNTYSYLDAEALIKFSQQTDGHDWTEVTMILNHKRAITLLLESVDTSDITPQWMSRAHSLLMRDPLDAPDLGRMRLTGGDIRIGGSSYRPSANHARLSVDLGALCWAVSETENPFEASFLSLAGMSYLQAFADGNKRMGRLSCNLPLLRAGLPPMSFLFVSASEYISALLVFYELGDAAPLADVVSQAYAEAAPHYKAALATQRPPRNAEIQNRARINRLVAEIVSAAAEGMPLDEDVHLRAALADLAETDRAVVAESVRAALAVIGPDNFGTWEVPPDNAAAFASMRAAAQAGDKAGHL
jgi:Fic family protein